jgi:hypothetical protein
VSNFTSPSKSPNSTGNLAALQAACYIVGCLASEDLVHVDLDDPHTFDNLKWAIKVVTECLRDYPNKGDSFMCDIVLNHVIHERD